MEDILPASVDNRNIKTEPTTSSCPKRHSDRYGVGPLVDRDSPIIDSLPTPYRCRNLILKIPHHWSVGGVLEESDKVTWVSSRPAQLVAKQMSTSMTRCLTAKSWWSNPLCGITSSSKHLLCDGGSNSGRPTELVQLPKDDVARWWRDA
jgi:hypothetical protein